ncbi:MAG: N-acetylmuramoyl-L-alanine amidase [Parachlamydiaceae bacterium]
MFFRIISLWLVICFATSMTVDAQSTRPSPLNLSKLPLLQSVEEGQTKTQIKPPLLVHHITIMVDPGHGGHDIGTQSISKPRYQEKSLNLVTAKFVRDFLEHLGYQVIMTREEDKFVSLDKRAKMANELKPTVYVSIHYNSAPIATAQGIEVFFYQSKDEKNKKEKERVVKSRRLAHSVLKNIVCETQAKSRGVKHGNYLVIRETAVPAILVEGGFVTNESEMQNLKDPVYLKRLAWGIVCGIEEYLNKLHLGG